MRRDKPGRTMARDSVAIQRARLKSAPIRLDCVRILVVAWVLAMSPPPWFWGGDWVALNFSLGSPARRDTRERPGMPGLLLLS